MVESALLAQLKSLESSWALLDSWLKFWIALVVVGVAMEVVVIIIEYRHECHAFNRGIIRPPDKPGLLLFAFGFLGAGLVAIGVAGEFHTHIKAGKVEADMREANRQLVALVNQRAADAGERASRNEREAAQLRKDAEGLKAENLRLEAIIAPRSLSLEQQRLIAAACKRFHGHNVLVSSNGGDAEAAAVGAQIILVLQAADITVLDNRGRSFVSGEVDVGIHIRNPFGASTENGFIIGVGKALSEIGKLKVSVNDPWPKTTGAMFGGGPGVPTRNDIRRCGDWNKAGSTAARERASRD